MKELQMPASYGRIPEAEQFQIVGGGELADAWNDFTDRLRLDDLFFSGGVLSLSFSFVPMPTTSQRTPTTTSSTGSASTTTPCRRCKATPTICARSARSAGSELSQPPSASVHPC